jgi:chorismate synthase
LEKTTLELLRKRYNIDQLDHDTQTRVNRNRKRKGLAPNAVPVVEPMVRIVRTRMLEDEDESSDEDN